MRLDQIAHRSFHDFVRGVFADHSTRARMLRARRASWLKRLAKRDTSAAEKRWEGEGGSGG